MKANDYQLLVMRTAKEGQDYEKALCEASMGLCGEAGECADIVKKHLFQGHELNKEELVKELGDTAWYLAFFSKLIDVNLSEVFEKNIEKLKKRYPEGFSCENSVNRSNT